MGIRTPLAKVRGLGSAKDGTHHWWMQRVTAIALVPLSAWLVFQLNDITFASQQEIVAWMQRPFAAVLLALFLCTGCYHAKLGIQVVIEDYIHGAKGRALIVLNSMAFWLLAAMALLAIGKMHFGIALPTA